MASYNEMAMSNKKFIMFSLVSIFHMHLSTNCICLYSVWEDWWNFETGKIVFKPIIGDSLYFQKYQIKVVISGKYKNLNKITKI